MKPADCNANGIADDQDLLPLTPVFEAGTTIFAPGWPESITAVDADGDGDFDLATTHSDPALLTLHLHQSAGAFAHQGDFPLASAAAPRRIRAADLDGDSLVDLAITQPGSHAVTLLRGGPGASLEPWRTVTTRSTDPAAMELADLDQDGDIDMLVAGKQAVFDTRIQTLRNRGDGDFDELESLALVGKRFHELIPGRFNDDGALDAAVVAFTGLVSTATEVIVLSGATDAGGRLSIQAPTSVVGVPHAAAHADRNADGLTDIAMILSPEHPRSELTLLLSTGGFRFAPAAVLLASSGLITLGAGELDGEPGTDFLAGRPGTGELFTLLGGRWGQAPRTALAISPLHRFVPAGDLTGDGRLDVVVEGEPMSNGMVPLAILRSTHREVEDDCDGNGVPDSCDLRTGDCNRDGMVDACQVLPAAATFTPGSFLQLVTSVVARSLAQADFDGDGDADLAVGGAMSDDEGRQLAALRVLVRDPAGELALASDVVGQADSWLGVIVAGDFTADGRIDVAGIDHPLDAPAVYINRGNLAFELSPIALDQSVKAYWITAADWDGDGTLDLLTLARRELAHELHVLVSTPNGWKALHPINAERSAEAVPADFDGDGLLDAAATADSTGLGLWRNLGGGHLRRRATFAGARGAGSLAPLAADDFDGDGDPDCVVVRGGTLSMLHNDSPWLLGPARTFDTGGSFSYSASAADVDGDGIADVVYPRNNAGCVAETSIQILPGARSLRRTPRTAAVLPRHVTVLDVEALDWDTDRRLDLAVLSRPPAGQSALQVLDRDPAARPGDCNSNGVIDSCERDCDGNGTPDECDLQAAASDCDGNGMLDACQPDCDGDGTADVCELRSDGRLDCDGDGILDRCQLSFRDDNGNQILDDCETDADPGLDCNQNGVLDSIDIQSRVHLLGQKTYALDAPLGAAADLDGDAALDILQLVSPGPDDSRFVNVRFLEHRRGRLDSWSEVTLRIPGILAHLARLDLDDVPELVVVEQNERCSDWRVLGIYTRAPDGRTALASRHELPGRIQDVETGDWNRDGLPDLVVATLPLANDRAVGELRFLGGDGRGALAAGAALDLRGSISYLAADDLDGDGAMDVTAQLHEGQVVLCFNDRGDFSAQDLPELSVSHVEVIVGDMTGDGLSDLAGVSSTRELVINVNQGQRIFRAAASSAIGLEQGAGRIAGGDFDGDGDLDIAAAGWTSIDPDLGALAVAIHANRGDGTFAPARILPLSVEPHRAVFGDFEGNGAGSLLVAGPRSYQFLSLAAQSSSGELEALALGEPARSLAAADWNQDGLDDLAAAGLFEIDVLTAGRQGEFEHRVLRSGSGPTFLAAADVDGDGAADLVAANRLRDETELPDTVSLHWNDGGRLGAAFQFAAGRWPDALAVGELNGRPGLEILTVNASDDGIVVLDQVEPRRFTGKSTMRLPQRCSSADLADFDGDGDLDVAVAAFTWESPTGLYIQWNDGHGGFEAEVGLSLEVAAMSLQAADIDGDGDPDLMALVLSSRDRPEGGAGRLLVLANDDSGRRFGAATTIALDLGATGMSRAADLDGDALLDVAVSQPHHAHISVVEGIGAAGHRLTRLGTFSTPQELDVFDRDGDGDLDLAVATTSPRLLLLENVSGPESSDHDRDGVPDECSAGGRRFVRGDVDADGRLALTDAIRVLHRLFLGGASLPCEDAADANDDGDVDITDPIRLLGHLFVGRPAPPAPLNGCGEDATPDALACGSHSHCAQ